MTIFTRDLIHRIIACVLLPLFFLQCLPCVTSQIEWEESTEPNKYNFSTGTIVGIILLGMFVSGLIFCCSFCALLSLYRRRLTVAQGNEVLHNGAATSGVNKDIIESFPFFPYSEVKELKIGKGGVECAICLKEFEDEDMLRWMPPCSHIFHVTCIDVWLSSQCTCPVCRANLSLKPGESFRYPSMDLETGNARRSVQEDISLIGNNVTWNNNANNRTTRSRSTGSLSSWRMAEIFNLRSHSTGHSLVQQGKNLDRFTLQLPEEVQRELVSLNLIRRSHMALPRAMSSRQGYRSSLSQGRQTLRRAISMSLSFSSVRSTVDRDNLVLETSQAKDKDFGEGSSQRLMPEKV